MPVTAASDTPTYSQITETPGIGATAEQLAMLITRYRLAAGHARGKRVIEVACGTGIGLGYLAREATAVVGTDIDEANLACAGRTYAGDGRISIRHADACRLPFPDASFDVVICFEALYYFADAGAFLAEARRVLAPGGTLVACAVNPGWSGFNPSPFATRYPVPRDLAPLFADAGFTVRVLAGFADQPAGLAQRAVGRIRSAAVALRLIPRTMKGKQLLKRMFCGKLAKLPPVLEEGLAEPSPLREVDPATAEAPYKVFYYVATTNA
jgi:SAM-dependent methyltransferase